MLDAFIIDRLKPTEIEEWEPFSLPLEEPEEIEEAPEDLKQERGIWTIRL